jgi:D-tyrosyl-tRNA(Tyr) deacylase
MKCVIQRVKHAKCEIDGKITGEIEVGYMILVGFKPEDNELIVDKMVKKIVNLRIFEDENQKMNLNIKQVNGKVLSISQFTLYANTNEGNRPSFANAMKPNQATILYDSFNHKLRSEGIETETGIFGADMQITLTNDGPVTIILEF